MKLYDKLPEKYSQAVIDLVNAYEKTDDYKVKRKHFATFVEKYTAIPHLWQYWIRFEKINFRDSNENETTEMFVDFYQKLKKTSSLHFYLCDPNFFKEPKIILNGEIFLSFPLENRKFSKLMTFPYYDDWCLNRLGELDNIETKLACLRYNSALLFPHRYLENIYCINEEYLTSPISAQMKQTFAQNISKFNEIKAQIDNKNYKTFIYLLEKTNDESFISQNIECILTENFWEKSLWKSYIEYLRNKNKLLAMLSVYSRYCRFFIDDLDMREEYFQEVLRLHKLAKKDVMAYWIDILKMEKDFEEETFISLKNEDCEFQKNIIKECYEKGEKYFKYCEKIKNSYTLDRSDLWFMNDNEDELSEFETIKIQKTKIVDFQQQKKEEKIIEKKPQRNILLIKKANFDNFKYQKFSFCSTIIRQISNNSLQTCSYKLNNTCKYFFALSQKCLCYKFVVKNEGQEKNEKMVDNSFEISATQINKQFSNDSDYYKRFIITSTLHIENPFNKNCFSTLFWSGCLFQIKYLKLSNQDLTMNDITILNETCKLLKIRLIDVNIFSEEDLVPVEAVVGSFPFARSLYLKSNNVIFTEESAFNLANLNRSVQFQEFILCEVSNKFLADDFCIFLKKHIANYGKIRIIFKDIDENVEYKWNFARYLHKFVFTKWKSIETAPNFDI